ncbi:MDR family oxidoreductase [Sphingorhabdus sp.]|jgi:acrylyl-CoA reductase (NADPH)|uniref:MDR family oxidoreductase n=1 Tax=Sphingorhabdus sp. TaxID=1902408 RepID=UPI002FD9DD0D
MQNFRGNYKMGPSVQEMFNAILIEDVDGKPKAGLTRMSTEQLPAEAVLVRVSHSALNYKDGLAVSARGRIARSLPMVAGIDLAGTVEESSCPAWKKGDRVLVNGFGLSERYWGGYSQFARMKSEWLVRIPDELTAEEVMAIGTAGYTSMLCVLAIEDHGIKPGDGPVLVTGASGGVGSVAVMLLSALGYEVVAASGRAEDNEKFLSDLGASRLIGRNELARAAKPLEAETWAAVVDSVGSEVLATAIAQTRYEGIVAACGLAGGTGLASTVMPFILRGVTLRGIDSVMASQARRQRAWNRLAELVDKSQLASIYSVEAMSEVPRLAHEIIDGKIRGRVVIDVNA